ncbi:MAG: galactose-6-phosphate isomerase subunit LacB [Peptoniphilaceae bacterium]|nr:galactose-6-phosphate isomerase subunit LacB [Peptoniphilaceae bacterium]MDY3738618.1 galactose-6-phosphate isomerase subunit LacB [Peptoniphilaceae bacterium]
MKIAIGCDHTVLELKEAVSEHLKQLGHEVIDCGPYDHTRTHYPIFGKKVGDLVGEGKVDLGVVCCGTGVGISTSVNKCFGARAALVRDVASAVYAKEKLNANVIAFGGLVCGRDLALEITDKFLEAKYEKNDENDKVVEKLMSLEKRYQDHQTNDEHFFDEEIKKWEEGYYHD